MNVLLYIDYPRMFWGSDAGKIIAGAVILTFIFTPLLLHKRKERKKKMKK